MCLGEGEGGVMCHGLASYLGKIVRNQGQASSFMNLLTSKSLIPFMVFFLHVHLLMQARPFFIQLIEIIENPIKCPLCMQYLQIDRPVKQYVSTWAVHSSPGQLFYRVDLH